MFWKTDTALPTFKPFGDSCTVSCSTAAIAGAAAKEGNAETAGAAPTSLAASCSASCIHA
eukprot:CAMPEP_0172756058 /NCGR_PEP_ID=MMETSP1074-20121228/161070_1 /TAXON_ID=2916 /ORGANISM="Ceratium fusus, Strain PA161109" /LENGTH=59 /DNA_ID=CAMNT_0013589263 /DNA_START=189 /DNA_END=364 /DNA_ORIENTATION=-